jgi:hypothetical protein
MTENPQKTWTLTLTPQGRPATTLSGIPHEQVASLLREVVHGDGAEALEAYAAERQRQPLAA